MTPMISNGLLLLVIVAGCGATPHALPATRVRLAHDNEFPKKELVFPDLEGCNVAGEVDRELYRPLVDYARANLLDPYSRRGSHAPSGLDFQWKGERLPAHPDGLRDWIEIDPRTVTGHLSIGVWEWTHGSSHWGRSTDYCVHVVDENGERVLVLVPSNYIVES